MHLMYKYLNSKILIIPLWLYYDFNYFKITCKLARKKISATNSFFNEIIGTGAIPLSTKVLQ